ncbi:MAG TPA: dephospho-CoA kinase [Actinobacteria bacterium]|nr:dephospho-CoA kinase [Actinomycetota bacterium]
MLIFGVTGNIGSGKSTISKMLSDLGAFTIDADVIALTVVIPNSQTFAQVVNEFGLSILQDDGTLDRKSLASIVFTDPRKLAILNEIVHPAIMGSIKLMVEKYRKTLSDEAVVVIDAPLIVETEFLSLVDSLLVVAADENVRLKRLLKKGYSREDALARMKSQTPSDVLVTHADYIINNNGTLEELKEKVDELWEKISGE